MDDALIGDVTSEAALHLKTCPACAARLAQAEMPLASFKAVSTAWSERRSATMPAIAPQHTNMGARGRLMAWSVALSAMIVAGVAVPVVMHQNSARDDRGQTVQPVQAAANPGATASTGMVAVVAGPVAADTHPASPQNRMQMTNSQDKISQDNAMLMDIDRELDAANATPAVLTLERPHGPLAKPQTINE